jgi:hypothetical protein
MNIQQVEGLTGTFWAIDSIPAQIHINRHYVASMTSTFATKPMLSRQVYRNLKIKEKM